MVSEGLRCQNMGAGRMASKIPRQVVGARGSATRPGHGDELVKPGFGGKWREVSEGAANILPAKLAYFHYAV